MTDDHKNFVRKEMAKLLLESCDCFSSSLPKGWKYSLAIFETKEGSSGSTVIHCGGNGARTVTIAVFKRMIRLLEGKAPPEEHGRINTINTN